MTFRRARQEDQKAERRAGILTQARALCQAHGILNWSLNELGRRSDVTKSNLYRYFGSREEILMTLMAEENQRFVDSFRENIGNQTLSLSEFSVLMAEQYASQPFLCDLLSLSSALLEHNVEQKKIRDIKLESMSQMDEIAGAIAQCLPDVSRETAHQIAFTSGIMVAGLWPMANPAAPLRRLSETEGLERLRLNFTEQLEQMLRAYLIGIVSPQLS